MDTHVLVWWWAGDSQLPRSYADLLGQLVERGEPAAISDISLWEIAMLVDRGRLEVAATVDTFLSEIEDHAAVQVLPIDGRIAAESTRLGPSFPRDPADRIIGATARCHGLPLMTLDRRIRDSGVISIIPNGHL
ncbi:type II toxin-antitoxin system VapC family toxin [Myxococcota bacterium]